MIPVRRSPRLRQASFLWLVAHEIRLAYRTFGTTRRWRQVLVIGAVLTLPCLIGPMLAWSLRHVDTSRGSTPGIVSLIAAGMLLLFTSLASVHVLRVFGERSDLDLLLASPVPRNRILAAKSVAVYTAAALPVLTVTTPFVLASALFGHPGWLGATVMIGVIAVIATSLAQLLARALSATLGLRLARTIYQIIGGVLGAVLFLSIQAANAVPSFRNLMKHAVARAPAPPFDLPARAALGALGPLAAMVALGVAIAWATTHWTATSLGNADAPAAASKQRPARVRFGASPTSTILRKELRLLARDPELLSQVLLQLLYLLPVFALLVTRDATLPLARIAIGCTTIAALLASSLSWLIVCAEDAPDLLDAAPVARTLVARGKLAAACLPPLSAVAVVAAVLAFKQPLAAAATMAASTAAALTMALLQARFGKLQPRRAFRRRTNGSLALTFGELGLTGIWAATAGLLINHPLWALGPLVVLAALLAALATGRGGVVALRSETSGGTGAGGLTEPANPATP